MSSREGHDAMALQREQVLMLLGAVTNPDDQDNDPSPQGESPCSLLSDGSSNMNQSRKTSFNQEHDMEETLCNYESIPSISVKKKKVYELLNGVESAKDDVNMEVENNFSEKLNETENEVLTSKSFQVSSSECNSTSTDIVGSLQSSNAHTAASNKSQSSTTYLSEGLEDIIKRAKMYTSQRLQLMNTSSAGGDVSNEVEADTRFNSSACEGPHHPTDILHDTRKYPAHNSKPINSALLNFKSPDLLYDYTQLFTHADEYTKGCKWSPDGELLMVLSSGQKFSIINPQIEGLSAQDTHESIQEKPLTITEGELVYDYQWYPFMSAADPDANCFVCCCRALPIHLWDASRGALVCSYLPYNHLDELAPAYSLGFSGDGSRLVCGFNKIIRVFDTARPGRKCSSMCAKKQNGIISCFSHHPHLHHVMAAGSYLGSVGLYSHNTGRAFCVLMGHTGGVTQVEFSDDGYRLYTGARMDDELLSWDVRQMGHVLQSYKRHVRSNQRVAFQLISSTQRVLVSGSTDGRVMAWRDEDYANTEWCRGPDDSFQAHDDCVNGISIHPHKTLLATSSGQRHALPHPDDHKSRRTQPPVPSVRIWTLAKSDAMSL